MAGQRHGARTRPGVLRRHRARSRMDRFADAGFALRRTAPLDLRTFGQPQHRLSRLQHLRQLRHLYRHGADRRHGRSQRPPGAGRAGRTAPHDDGAGPRTARLRRSLQLCAQRMLVQRHRQPQRPRIRHLRLGRHFMAHLALDAAAALHTPLRLPFAQRRRQVRRGPCGELPTAPPLDGQGRIFPQIRLRKQHRMDRNGRPARRNDVRLRTGLLHAGRADRRRREHLHQMSGRNRPAWIRRRGHRTDVL